MYEGLHFVYSHNSDRLGYLFLNSYQIQRIKLVLGRELLETDTLKAERNDSWSLGRKKKTKEKKKRLLEPLNLALKSRIGISVF